MNYLSSFTTFVQMGGYADYVWPAYAIGFVILLVNFLIANIQLRRTIKKLRNKHANKT